MSDAAPYKAPPELRAVATIVAHSPASSGQYIGSPSLVVLPTGDYLMSHDLFGPESDFEVSHLYRSGDGGRTWEHISRVTGQFWSNLFWHEGAAYWMGTTRRYGGVALRRSDDLGHTWTEPRDETSGLLLDDGQYHCAPMPTVAHNGRLWRAMEDVAGDRGWADHFRAFVMSAPCDADLLRADSWTSCDRLAGDSAWLNGRFGGWLEGNAVVTPQETVVDLLRVEVPPGPEAAALIEISADGVRATFDPDRGFVEFPGGAKKFTVRRDDAGQYWSLTNPVLEHHAAEHPGKVRNALALASSDDLRQWEMRGLILHHPDIDFHGFQYVDWLIDGDDLLVASRTAFDDGLGGAHNQHDANYLTFHRVTGFGHPAPTVLPH